MHRVLCYRPGRENPCLAWVGNMEEQTREGFLGAVPGHSLKVKRQGEVGPVTQVTGALVPSHRIT